MGPVVEVLEILKRVEKLRVIGDAYDGLTYFLLTDLSPGRPRRPHTHPTPPTFVLSHIDELEGDSRGRQRSLHHCRGRAHEGVHGSVGGFSRVHIQEQTAFCPSNGIRDRFDHFPIAPL